MLNIIHLDNIESVYATGDLHGNFKDILGLIKRYDLKNCVIIFCGDITMGFYKEDYYKQMFNRIKKEIKKRNVYILFVRGNHDCLLEFNSNKWKDKYIQTVIDYTIVNINNQFNILCVGGGVSIDRMDRIEENERRITAYKYFHRCSLEEASIKASKVYWDDEMPIYCEDKLNEIKKENITINAVCTHTSPHFCTPLTKEGIASWLKKDKNLSEDLNIEREKMTKLYNKLIEDMHPLSYWCYGHFHFHYFDCINNIKFFLLDMDRNGIIDFVEIYRKEIDEIGIS